MKNKGLERSFAFSGQRGATLAVATAKNPDDAARRARHPGLESDRSTARPTVDLPHPDSPPRPEGFSGFNME